MRIWYDKVAKKRRVKGGQRADKFQNRWQQQALPLGNGSLGITLTGAPFDEYICVNEKSLWTGGPSPKRENYNGGNIESIDGKATKDYFDAARQKLALGENADDLCEKLVGDTDGYGSYQCAGLWKIKTKRSGYSDYIAQLDLDSAEMSVVWRQGDGEYKRTAFVSHPDKVAVVTQNLGSESEIEIVWDSSADGVENMEICGNLLRAGGRLKDNDLAYVMCAKLICDGEVTSAKHGWKLKGKSFTLIFTYVTDYSDEYPKYRSGETMEDLYANSASIVATASNLGVEALRKRHLEDWTRLWNAMRLTLETKEPGVPTDRLLARYSRMDACGRRWLEQLLFAYGRYLMIASSRKDDLLPCNLQGIWNISNSPAWGSDYHFNINLQMNYWMAPLTGLSECAMPLVRYLDKLRRPGRKTAQIYCGIGDGESESGYLYHTQNTPFGWTCPGWVFRWGWSTAAAAWILHNIYEIYAFDADRDLLQQIYPMLKEATLTYDALLEKSGNRWVTSPCYSPEHGPITRGNAYEQIFIWQLYTDVIDCANALGVDADEVVKWQETVSNLRPLEVGQDGQILEWYHEKELGSVGEKRHRHVSHLMGLYPCALIDENDKSLLDATKVSLEDRGDKSTGWATALRLCLWARLYDGDRAYKLIDRLIENNIYSNLWDTHPPFQIDGNFGYTAGVCEMLAHSHGKAVKLLPTLPSVWASGSVSGLHTRGGFYIDMSWRNGKLAEFSVHSLKGGVFKVYAEDNFKVTDGNVREVETKVVDGILSWDCEKGHVYRVSKI